MRSLRLLFLGSSDFAVPSLKALQSSGHTVVGAVTAPDKPQGRGQRMFSTPVKQYAMAHSLPVYQPARLRDPDLKVLLQKLRPDVQIVVAFRKLPREVWDFPPMGSINLHASLLPAYRGAAPINWALIRGEKQTGLSTFFITEDIDTGPLLLQEEVSIAPDDTAGSLHDRMSQQGADLLLRTLEKVAKGDLKAHPQPLSTSSPTAPKLSRATCQIDWTQSESQIRHFVRGLAPSPGAWTLLDDMSCKIYKLSAVEEPKLEPGSHLLRKDGLFFGSATGTLSVEDIQIAGKRRMLIADFLRGRKK